VWDVENRLASVSQGAGATTFEYDYTGMRVEKNAPGATTIYPFQGYEVDPNGIVTKFIRIGIETFAANRGGTKYFYHNDHLGGVNVITNISGAQVQLNEYDPWGKVSKSVGSVDPTHRFTGKELDPESGLYYYGGRYYDPELGRFISADPFVPQPSDPQSLNRYSYVLNNPQNYVDPTGYFFGKLFKAIGEFFKAIFSKPQYLFASIAAAVVTGGIAAAVAGPAGFGFSAATVSTISSVAGGAAGGATFAGLTGGNPLLGALMGGAGGYIAAGGLGGGIIDGVGFDFGKSIIGTFATEIANDVTRGFLIGTTTSLISGRKFGDALIEGLAFGIVGAAGAQANNLIGHAVGFVASGFQAPEFRDGAFFYKIGFKCESCTAITIGNAITYNAQFGIPPRNILGEFAPLGDAHAPYNIRVHELGHVPQSRVLGFLYLPAHALSQALSIATTLNSHRLNFLQRVWHPAPSY
jgi:RHS repeat-associated protein